MSIASLLLMALGLSMDAFAVAVTNGICFARAGKKEAFSTAFAFGFFQGMMPSIGYFAGRSFLGCLRLWADWVSLLLLGFIGGKMIWEALRELRAPQPCETGLRLSLRLLLIQAAATSVDAMAAGVGLAAQGEGIILAALLTAMVAFGCSLAGVYLGRRCGMFLRQKAEIFGGALLILLGLKIFFGK
ncbi:MAG: manganese efflux pump [Oscillospiraceae bacterium]|nr:manganese efflux pump [Oscillospiraceae bacterium]